MCRLYPTKFSFLNQNYNKKAGTPNQPIKFNIFPKKRVGLVPQKWKGYGATRQNLFPLGRLNKKTDIKFNKP
jgi:hypothetical protein